MTQISIRKEVFPFLNISLYLNQIKPIRSIFVLNSSDEPKENLELNITSDLPVMERFCFKVNEIPANAKIVVKGAFFVNAKLSNAGGHEH